MNLPTITIFDNFLKKKMELYPYVFISSRGELVIEYRSKPENYRDFGDTEETYSWLIGSSSHIQVRKVST